MIYYLFSFDSCNKSAVRPAFVTQTKITHSHCLFSLHALSGSVVFPLLMVWASQTDANAKTEPIGNEWLNKNNIHLSLPSVAVIILDFF